MFVGCMERMFVFKKYLGILRGVGWNLVFKWWGAGGEKMCVFMVCVCICVYIIVSGEDIFGNLGCILRIFGYLEFVSIRI